MDELRFVRREDLALIVANDADEEFRLVVDEAVLSELRHLSRREREPAKVRPREIQALIRSGKSRAQVAQLTGLEEPDIERYEEPVLAERRYILELAQAVPVRVDAVEDEESRFGAVIEERLESFQAEAAEWSSWKEDETGWLIGIEFISHDTAHRAVWSFDHRKSTLAPTNSDAVNLSKQGEVGDRLIPKLRAVDDRDRSGRFHSDAFDQSQLPVQEEERPASQEPAPHDTATVPSETTPATDADNSAPLDAHAEYERRREIDHRAVKTDESAGIDLSQTADLLDALRRRRGEREQRILAPAEPANQPAPTAEASAPRSDPAPAAPRPRSIWAAGGVSREAGSSAAEGRSSRMDSAAPVSTTAPVNDIAAPVEDTESNVENAGSSADGKHPVKSETPRKGRASIPSWDDILFGTRSDEDPV